MTADKQLKEGKKYGIWVGGHREVQYDHRWSLQTSIEDVFAKKPAVRAKIYKHLYFTGVFDEWVEGFGVVTIVDAERREAYELELRSIVVE